MIRGSHSISNRTFRYTAVNINFNTIREFLDTLSFDRSVMNFQRQYTTHGRWFKWTQEHGFIEWKIGTIFKTEFLVIVEYQFNKRKELDFIVKLVGVDDKLEPVVLPYANKVFNDRVRHLLNSEADKLQPYVDKIAAIKEGERNVIPSDLAM